MILSFHYLAPILSASVGDNKMMAAFFYLLSQTVKFFFRMLIY